MVAPEDCDNRQKGWWERLALLQYATLRTTNAARSLGGLPAAESQRSLLQAAFEGAKGSQMSCQIGRATPTATTLATTSTPSTANVSTSARFRHYFNIFLLS